MTEAELPLPEGWALVVSGAANWQVADRYLPPEIIAPLQLIGPNGVVPCAYFDRFQDVGVSSLVPVDGGRAVAYTTGGDLVRLSLDGGPSTPLDVSGLSDVHELTLDGERLLVANTGRDEAVAVDVGSGAVAERVDLAPLRVRGHPSRLAGREATASFHLNQVVVDGDRMLGLVHHTEGFRLFFHAQRRLTGHGSGGILDLRSGWRKDLRLHAPHTLRRRPGGWLVLNSGRRELLLLDDRWEPVGVVPLRGWGRGGALAPDGRTFFAGISGIRRRYARAGDSMWTGVEAVDLTSGQRWSVQLPDIEQVNAVELCPLPVAEALLGLPQAPATPRREAARSQAPAAR